MTNTAKASDSNTTSALQVVLADVYLLALKTHGFHWNVEGPTFPQLHALFGTQYEALFEAADEVAERIRALKTQAPGSFEQFKKIATIREQTGALAADAMVTQLASDYDALAIDVQKGINVAADADDVGTEDLLTGLLRDAHKQAWMLRAIVSKA
jgi:starvation-inducible DNA-binding protein